MGPRDPSKQKKSFFLGFLVIVGPKKSPKKISAIFGTGCQKVCTWSVNGALIYLAPLPVWNSLGGFQKIQSVLKEDAKMDPQKEQKELNKEFMCKD